MPKDKYEKFVLFLRKRGIVFEAFELPVNRLAIAFGFSPSKIYLFINQAIKDGIIVKIAENVPKSVPL